MVPLASAPPFIDHIQGIRGKSIVVTHRRRPLPDHVVAELAESIERIGLTGTRPLADVTGVKLELRPTSGSHRSFL